MPVFVLFSSSWHSNHTQSLEAQVACEAADTSALKPTETLLYIAS